MINCPFCGKLTDPKLENCPHCGMVMPRQSATPEQHRRAGRAAVAQHCPNCHALVQDGDIICVACGTNLLTGQKIAEEQKQHGGVLPRTGVLWVALVVIVALLVLIGIMYAVYALSRDPVQQAVELAKMNKYLEAYNMLSDHLVKHPEDARANFVSGQVLWKMNRQPDAALAFEKAADLEPNNAQAGMLAVLSLARSTGNKSRAKQIALLRNLVRNNKDDRDALHLLALELGAEKDIAGQIEALRNAAELGALSAAGRQSLGVALALQGDYEGAERELSAAAEQTGGGGDTAAAMGFAANLAGEADVAETNLRVAVDTDTALKEEALTRLGLLLVSQGHCDEAREYLSQAMAANNDNMTARFFYAGCLEVSGLIDEALSEFQAIAQGTGPLGVESSIRAAALYLAQGDADTALSAVEKAELAGGDSARVHTMRGRVLMRLGQDDRARSAFRKASATDADYAPAYLESGLLYVKREFFDQGLQELERYQALVGDAIESSEARDLATLVEQLEQAIGRERGGARTGPTGRGGRDAT